MKYFRVEEDPTAKLPKNFMSGFLEVSHTRYQPSAVAGLFSKAAIMICLSAVANVKLSGPKLELFWRDETISSPRGTKLYIC